MGDPGPPYFTLGVAFGVCVAGAFCQYADWVNRTQRSWLQRRLPKRILAFAPPLLLGVICPGFELQRDRDSLCVGVMLGLFGANPGRPCHGGST